MSRICVMTADGRAYYAIVSKLRGAGLPFLSLVPGDRSDECELVLTTRAEAGLFRTPTMALEDLDENLDVTRGQILARLSEGDKTLLVGLDPGSRIGMAAFLGDARIASQTFNSKVYACNGVIKLVEGVSARRSFVRIGDGDPGMAAWLAENLSTRLPKTVVELVDESGTSRKLRVKGLQKDQGSAAKIAFRKGSPFRYDDRTSRSP
ncbi:MAG: hypothetical protein LYZ69_07480 [Nitrososphaerales archaeon]|nr:hypothetical protein [Nitrososphaerales archaeon]